MEASITLKNVGKKFDEKYVISDLSIGIEKNSTFTIIGQDGAGKTTLLKLLSTAIEKDRGHIYVQGTEIGEDIKKVRRNIGYLPDHNIHNNNLSARENIKYYHSFGSLSSYEYDKNLEYFIELFEFSDSIDKKPANYPKGFKRRLDLIQVLMEEPEILIMDEPLKELDYFGREILIDYLMEIKDSTTIIIASDDFTEIETITDRWVVLHNGSIRYDGNLETIVEHTTLDFTGYIEIKQKYRQDVLRELKEREEIKALEERGNTIELRTDNANKFFTVLNRIGPDKFYRISGNSVNMNYFLRQLTSNEGY